MERKIGKNIICLFVLFYFVYLNNNISYCQDDKTKKDNPMFCVYNIVESYGKKKSAPNSVDTNFYFFLDVKDPFKNLVYHNGKKGGDYRFSITFYRLPDIEKKVFNRINQYRKENGLNTLKWSEGLSRAGAIHIDYCAQIGSWEHQQAVKPYYDETLPLLENPSDRIKFLMIEDPKENENYKYSAENLFFFSSFISSDKSWEEIPHLKEFDKMTFEGWKKSPGHNSNMLLGKNEYAKPAFMGISVYLLRKEYKSCNEKTCVYNDDKPDHIYYQIIVVMLMTYGDPYEKGFKKMYKPFFPTIVGKVDYE